ncbi:DUF6894 family protein [Devosia sp. A16]|uniref:DUF6894 family protein n=1 Tax=Devosia sp. A16 TaxID=1736675 RepID=UPI0006D85748|nr:hypothetical protein [Devosia sp. A16]
MRFYFDIRDGDEFTEDDAGVELPDLNAARLQATIALTEMARDYLPRNGDERRLAIHVRTDEGPQLDVTLDYELEHLRKQERS